MNLANMKKLFCRLYCYNIMQLLLCESEWLEITFQLMIPIK